MQFIPCRQWNLFWCPSHVVLVVVMVVVMVVVVVVMVPNQAHGKCAS